MMDPATPQYLRAPVMGHTLWVTRHHDDEKWPCGTYPTQSETDDGLTAWIADDESLVNTDVVLWYVFGIHHITRLEDWPIMPVDTVSFWLKPFGFFDRNPVARRAAAAGSRRPLPHLIPGRSMSRARYFGLVPVPFSGWTGGGHRCARRWAGGGSFWSVERQRVGRRRWPRCGRLMSPTSSWSGRRVGAPVRNRTPGPWSPRFLMPSRHHGAASSCSGVDGAPPPHVAAAVEEFDPDGSAVVFGIS